MTASGHTHLHEKKGSEEHMVPLCLGCAEKIVAADAKRARFRRLIGLGRSMTVVLNQ